MRTVCIYNINNTPINTLLANLLLFLASYGEFEKKYIAVDCEYVENDENKYGRKLLDVTGIETLDDFYAKYEVEIDNIDAYVTE